MIELRDLQLCQLDIALEIKKICDENNIPYFLIGGTLLGAVRHKGFIPWDDDLDIGFLRKEYDRFIEICKSKLPAHLFLQTWDTDKGYALPFAKVMLKGTKFREEANGTSKAQDMIFVDVFPFDNMPDNVIKGKIYFIIEETAKKLLQYKLGYDMSSRSEHKILHKMLKMFSHMFSVNFLKRCIYLYQTKENGKRTRFLVNYNGAYRDKEKFSVTNIKTVPLSFEGYDFTGPAGWNELLKNMYGDYMELPPIEKRGNRHKAVDADMGNYIIKHEVKH